MKIVVDDEKYMGVTFALEQYEGHVHLGVALTDEPTCPQTIMLPETARALAGVLMMLASEVEAGR